MPCLVYVEDEQICGRKSILVRIEDAGPFPIGTALCKKHLKHWNQEAH